MISDLFLSNEFIIILILTGVFIYFSTNTPYGKKVNEKNTYTYWGWWIRVIGYSVSVIFLMIFGAIYSNNILWFSSKVPLLSSLIPVIDDYVANPDSDLVKDYIEGGGDEDLDEDLKNRDEDTNFTN